MAIDVASAILLGSRWKSEHGVFCVRAFPRIILSGMKSGVTNGEMLSGVCCLVYYMAFFGGRSRRVGITT